MHAKRINFIRFIVMALCFTLILSLIPLFAQPIHSSAEQREMGLWWWWPADGFDTTLRDQYLEFFDKAGITEIYFYGYDAISISDDTRARLHEFVQAANALNMKVSILYDDKNICNASYDYLIDDLKTAYLTYTQAYPNDNMNGYHFDIERFDSSQDYCTNFIGGIQALRAENIPVSVDVNPTKWNSSSVTLNDVSGMYNIIAANVDTMTLMSYRQNADKVVECGETCLAACKKYGTKILYGLETDNSGEEGVDFYGKTLSQLYYVINNVFTKLDNSNMTVDYGMAIHQNRSFYNMEGSLPDPNATTTQPSIVGGEIVGHVLYEDNTLAIQEYVYSDSTLKISTPALATALQEDFANNGLINDSLGEYYRITVTLHGSSRGYVYPCLYDAEDDWDFWPTSSKDDYPNGAVVYTQDAELISLVHNLYNSKEDKNGKFVNENDGICLYVEEYGKTLYISGIKVEVFRLEGGTIVTTPTTEYHNIPGDVNEDNSIDMKDVLALRKKIAHMDPGIVFNEVNADLNNDQSIDMKDVLILRKSIANN